MYVKVFMTFLIIYSSVYCASSRYRMYRSLTQQHCVPCTGSIPPLTNKQEDVLTEQIPNWYLNRNFTHCLRREFRFKYPSDAFDLIIHIADIAEAEGHHPDIYLFLQLLAS